MILTKDNLIRFVREKKYVTPTIIAENFETTTMIASAALSELAKDKLVLISNLKLGSTPYYYDPLQKECLIELGEKQFSGYDKDIFSKLKSQEVINENALSIQEKLAVERIKDFAKELIMEISGKQIKFWIWYLRDINETRKLIEEALNPKNQKTKNENTNKNLKENKEKNNSNIQSENIGKNYNYFENIDDNISVKKNYNNQKESKNESSNENSKFQNSFSQKQIEENKSERFIENFLNENYLKIESKTKNEKGIFYSTSIRINKMIIHIDCQYFNKKTSEAEIIKFYTSSLKPKIVFIENCPKKIFQLVESIENINIINI